MIETSFSGEASIALAIIGILVIAASVATRRGPILEAVPWPHVKRAIEWIRRRWYTRDWPDRPGVIVEGSARDLERWLRGYEGFEGCLFSHRYRGEVMNVRRPWGLDHAGRQLELHVRARELDNGRLEVLPHRELSRYEHFGPHIHDEDLNWERGHDALMDVLSGPSAPVEFVEQD